MSLSFEDFNAFHHAVHRADAFDWQKRLLREVIRDRKWPPLLDLPTGVGKTTCIDIALFALALDAATESSKRWCPRRIVMVVDRRIVVDQVAERGRKLLVALTDANAPPVVREVADRLRQLSAEAEDPLRVFTLRGGMPKDDGWTKSPDQPLIIASTVDQFGSRLLMQGFGVSREMRPIHAGLLGNDVLLLLDEVHLSQPFAETLEALTHLRKRFTGSSELTPRFQHAFLSATAAPSDATPFVLLDVDKAPESRLGPRLHASKPVSLIEVADRTALERACIDAARDLIDRHNVIAVIVNRIASVSTIVGQLRCLCDESIEIVPLTGRMRPLDRDDVLNALRPRVKTGRERSSTDHKLIVVATQCIEAGADFDFDAMVTEAASLDALRQRFGRLDRLGDHRQAQGTIIWDRSVKDHDPVYRGAIDATMTWLKAKLSAMSRSIDFGILALTLPATEELTPMLSRRMRAPQLLPAYLDLWAQTSLDAGSVPDVCHWLHGEDAAPADVQVVWRIDLTEEDLARAAAAPIGDLARDWPVNIISAVPPSSLEAISLPFAAAKRWLSGHAAGDVTDLEGVAEENQELKQRSLVLRWVGEDSEVVLADSIRPGDTIIIPATRGGIQQGCFEPTSNDAVCDLAERATFLSKGQPVLRLIPQVLHQLKLDVPLEELSEARAALTELAKLEPAVEWRGVWLKWLTKGQTSVWVETDRPWYVLRGRRAPAAVLRELLRADVTVEDGIELTTDRDNSPHSGQPVRLAEHSADVERFARTYADNVLPRHFVNDLALAGWLHDIGKADRRFQIQLRKGSEVGYLKDDTPWAKSGMSPSDRAAHRLAQKMSKYPPRARHEVQSLAMLEQCIDEVRAKARDVDLVLHLVASHHGHCKPDAPVAIDQEPVEVTLALHKSKAFGSIHFPPTSSNHELHRLDSSVAARYWRLTRKYGWLELCWLETVLRLADHSASAYERDAGGQA